MMTVRAVSAASVGQFPGTWPTFSFPLADHGHAQFLEIRVTDNGIGIAQEDFTKLFNAFSQIDSSLARQFEGTGLGLATVKELSELHGGTVGVASAEGEGAQFAVWLPLIPVLGAPAAENAGLDDAALQSLGGLTALVVEDDRASAELIRVLLEAEGFHVVVAGSGAEALRVAPHHQFSLVTLDIRLPDVDGWELLARLRQESTLAQVPALVLTGDATSRTARPMGALAVLPKPLKRAQLEDALAKHGLSEDATVTRHVLIVDDDPKAVNAVGALLKPPIYTVHRSYGGAEAIDLARRVTPDVVLLDLVMPDVSGFDVIEALQADSRTAAIPVVLMTEKDLTTHDRAALDILTRRIQVVQKAGFDRHAFLDSVRTALLQHGEMGR